jgi:hypothetical protein
MEALHSNNWWSIGFKFISNGAYGLYHKGIQCVDKLWVSEHKTPLTCGEVKLSSHLPRHRLVTRPSLRPTYELNCAHLLDKYSGTTLPEQLIGLYRNKEVGSLLLYNRVIL